MFIQRANNNFDIQLADIPVSPFTNTYSLDFDGIDDVLSLGENSTVGNGGVNTISFWVKGSTQSSGGITNYLFSNYGSYNWWRFFHADGTNLYWRNINGVAFNIAPNVFDGNWHNIVVIRNPSDLVNGSLRIYVDNGTPLDRTLDWRYGVAGFYNGALGTIGNNNTSNSGFNGNIDEVAVWNSEITPSDVATLSTSPTVDLTSLNPLAWYRNGDNGSWKSPQWLIPNNENKDKVSNYSFEFDGTDDRVQLSSDFVASGEFTLSFWMKPVAAGSGNGKIYPIGTFPGNSNYVKLDQIGVMWLRLGGSNAIFNESVYGGGANNLVLNDWQNIVFIRDSSNIIRCYRNGVDFGYNVASATNSNTLTLNSFGRIITNTFGFQGGLDEIAYWNSDETANLSTIYNGGEPTTLPSGVVKHYRLGEEANFTSNWLVDNSALDNYSKRSFYFDGTDQYLNVGGLSTLASASSFSISLWVKKGTSATNYRRICGKYTSASDNILLEFSGTNIFPRFYVTNGGVSSYVTANVGLTFNTWQNLVVVFDGSLTGNQNRAKIYLDGNNITATDVGTIPATTSADVSDFYFGKANGLGVFYWLGNQDEIGIFNYPLTPTQVTSVYNGGVPDDLMNTVGLTPPTNNYRMGEDASFNGTNWTVPDNVGTNDGTSVNMDVDDLIGEAANYSGGGISNGMTIEDRVGNAPNSDNNVLSINMEREDRIEDTP